ncbi:MAG TPA: DNA repair protein RadC [Pseudogracilibacillus sp.]|nr:DNA repair protein RadC [Pseudogracilibacillus sp.]
MQLHVKLKDVPKAERPRERLLQYGSTHLSNKELIALLLGSGTKNESVLDLANRVLMHFEGLKLLKEATIEELTAIKGIGPARGVILLAALELGERLNKYKPTERYVVRSPEDGADYVMEEMRTLDQEHFIALFLNTKNQIIHSQTIFIGTLNSSVVHPREIFREAVRRSSASIIVAHNHPSGDPTPSPEDINVTKRLVKAGKIMGIEVLDHLVIGDGKFISLKEKGHL